MLKKRHHANGSSKRINTNVECVRANIYVCVHVVSMCHHRTTILSIICIRLFVSMEASDQKEKFRLFFRAALAMPAKCDSFTGAQTHTWHTDGGLCDLCQTYNRCTFVFGYQQTWHQLSRYIHIFFSSLVMRMKKKTQTNTEKRNIYNFTNQIHAFSTYLLR